jgi:hypothetical protein
MDMESVNLEKASRDAFGFFTGESRQGREFAQLEVVSARSSRTSSSVRPELFKT